MNIDLQQSTIYFGTARDAIFPDQHRDARSAQELLQRPQFSHLIDSMNIHSLLFNHQVHGTQGDLVSAHDVATFVPFEREGDYLITTTPGIGIGVMTGDCLPMVIHDTTTPAIAVVHAGWKGSVAQVAIKALEQMQQKLGTKLENVQIFFGPAARRCCYQVTPEFLAHLAPHVYAQQAVHEYNGTLFFDVPLFNQLQLIEYGVPSAAICQDYVMCTMCHHTQFYSHRWHKEKAGRQMTVACLK